MDELTFWQTQVDRIHLAGGQIKIKIKNSEDETKWLNLTSEQYLALEEFLLDIEN